MVTSTHQTNTQSFISLTIHNVQMGFFIGFLRMVAGFILIMGNSAGCWHIFPVSGWIVMCIGGLVLRITRA